MKQLEKASICIHFLNFLVKYANARGIRTDRILKDINFDSARLTDPDYRIPATLFLKIWQRVENDSENVNFGLHMGEDLTHFPFNHIVFSVMLNDKEVLSALKNLIRYHTLMTDLVDPGLFLDETTVVFSLEDIDHTVLNRHYTEFTFSMILSFLRHLSLENLNPCKVSFTHKEPENKEAHARFFKSKLVFGATGNEMVFERNLLEKKVNLSNPDLLPLLELNAESKLEKLNETRSWSEKVSIAIHRKMASGPLSIDQIADDLVVSRRTLQNRLKEEGVTFRSIYENKRKEKAMALLKNRGIAIIDAAFLLGFSEQSAFNHAFKKWTKMSPGEYMNCVRKRD